jgi:hypothetical protein
VKKYPKKIVEDLGYKLVVAPKAGCQYCFAFYRRYGNIVMPYNRKVCRFLECDGSDIAKIIEDPSNLGLDSLDAALEAMSNVDKSHS